MAKSGTEIADHPRSRGEHVHGLTLHEITIGSSPLTRGTRNGAKFFRLRGRIIPAHAGNTQFFNLCSLFLRDHPRSRGEHRRAHLQRAERKGSSPLTRGTPASCFHMFSYPGIIPAHAGNTLSFLRLSTFNLLGSSPLTRGTLIDDSFRSLAHGIIPAHAGNTRLVSSRSARH